MGMYSLDVAVEKTRLNKMMAENALDRAWQAIRDLGPPGLPLDSIHIPSHFEAFDIAFCSALKQSLIEIESLGGMRPAKRKAEREQERRELADIGKSDVDQAIDRLETARLSKVPPSRLPYAG